jgi:hypothetical protein
VPTFFWSHDEQGGDALVFIGAPGDLALATLWDDAARGDDVLDLTALDETPTSAGASEPSHAESSLWSLLERVDGLVKVQSL